jgi:hypothetical protein
MSLNHPSLAVRTCDLERDLLLTRVVAHRQADHAVRSGQQVRGVFARVGQRLGHGLVAIGRRLQGPSPAADVLALPRERGAGA